MCRAVDCFSNLVKALTKYERPKMKRDACQKTVQAMIVDLTPPNLHTQNVLRKF